MEIDYATTKSSKPNTRTECHLVIRWKRNYFFDAIQSGATIDFDFIAFHDNLLYVNFLPHINTLSSQTLSSFSSFYHRHLHTHTHNERRRRRMLCSFIETSAHDWNCMTGFDLLRNGKLNGGRLMEIWKCQKIELNFPPELQAPFSLLLFKSLEKIMITFYVHTYRQGLISWNKFLFLPFLLQIESCKKIEIYWWKYVPLKVYFMSQNSLTTGRRRKMMIKFITHS